MARFSSPKLLRISALQKFQNRKKLLRFYISARPQPPIQKGKSIFLFWGAPKGARGATRFDLGQKPRAFGESAGLSILIVPVVC